MQKNVQNLNFTRYIYGLKYACPNTFNEFTLLNRYTMFSTIGAKRYEMANRVQIEPFKGINTNTKGAKLYFRNHYLHDPKDETAMFSTLYKNIYHGDLKFFRVDGIHKKILVLFQILPEDEQLIIDVFDDYLPNNPKERTQLIDEHQWHKKTTL